MAFEITRLIVDSVELYDAIHQLNKKKQKVASARGRLQVGFFHGELIDCERIIDNRYLTVHGDIPFFLELDVYASDSTLWQPRLEKVSTYTTNDRQRFCHGAQLTYSGPFYDNKVLGFLANSAAIIEYARFCLQTQHFLKNPETREHVADRIRRELFQSLDQTA